MWLSFLISARSSFSCEKYFPCGGLYFLRSSFFVRQPFLCDCRFRFPCDHRFCAVIFVRLSCPCGHHFRAIIVFVWSSFHPIYHFPLDHHFRAVIFVRSSFPCDNHHRSGDNQFLATIFVRFVLSTRSFPCDCFYHTTICNTLFFGLRLYIHYERINASI